jgi:hypothetical protein
MDNALIAPGSVTGDPVMDELLRRARPEMLAPAAPAAAPAGVPRPAAQPVQAPPSAMIARASSAPAPAPAAIAPAAAQPAQSAAPQPDYLERYQDWEASRPTLDPNAGKPSILRRILGGAAAGMIGFDNPREGVEVGREIVNAPRAAAQRDFDNREKAWEDQGRAIGDEQRIAKAQTADTNAAADRARAMIAPAAPAANAVNNDNPQANAAASLGMIAQDMAGNPREAYGGPMIAPGAGAGAAPANHGPVVRTYVNDKLQHVNVFKDGTEAATGTVKDTIAERGAEDRKLVDARANLKRLATGGGATGGAAAVVERDMGPAPAGKAEGSTGKLPDGTPVVVRNGHAIAQEQKGTNGQKLTAANQGRKEFASSVLEQIPPIDKEIDDIAAETGPAAGRWNQWWVNKAGVNDPAFAGLDEDLGLLASAIAVMHFGARGGGQQFIQSLKHDFSQAQSPEDLKARIQSAYKWGQGYATMGGAQ